MNRRGFFKRMLGAAVVAATARYAPSALKPVTVATPTKVLTLAEWAKLRDPYGAITKVAEILNQSNELLSDVNWVTYAPRDPNNREEFLGIPTRTGRE